MHRNGRIVDPDLWSPHVPHLIALSGKVAGWPTIECVDVFVRLIEVTSACIGQTSGDVGGQPVDPVLSRVTCHYRCWISHRVKYMVGPCTCTPYSPWSSYLGIRKLRSPNT
jgi:hypothetical protein